MHNTCIPTSTLSTLHLAIRLFRSLPHANSGVISNSPRTGKKKRFSKEREQEARELAELIGELVSREKMQRAIEEGLPTVGLLITRWKAEEMPFQPWDPGTRENYNSWFKRTYAELGHKVVQSVTALQLHNWLANFCTNADLWNHYRYALILLWWFAVLQQMCITNEAEKVIARSTSKKLAMNRKLRRRLSIKGYKAIHALAYCGREASRNARFRR